jgi:tripartite-type tricarboxylate transporter receptor subunit TctC
MHRPLLPIAAALAITAALSGPTHAQSYPTKSIRMIGPSSPGGGVDTNGRILANHLSQSLGQQVVFENRPGAGGRIGAELASKAPPDGYTLLFSAAASITIHPNTYKNLPYDPVRDFDPVSLFASSEYILAVHPSLPVKNVKDLIALAKAKPGQIVYGSSGTFGLPHLGGVLLEQAAGIKMLHVPYKGGGPAAQAILGGEVAFMFGTGPTVVPLAKAGRLRLIAIASDKRSPAMPQLPTVAETVPGVEVSAWYGLLVPAGTPKPIIERLHAETVKAANDPKVAAMIRNAGGEPVTSTPAQFAAHIKAEIARWAKAVKAANLPLQE